MPPSPTPRKQPGTAARQISSVLELPILLVACVGIGGGLGFFLDARFHTSPVMTLVFGVLGFAAGMVQLIRTLSKDTKTDGGS